MEPSFISSPHGLSLAAFAMATLAFLLALAALWPRLAPWLAAMRDAILWLALAAVIVGGSYVVWKAMNATDDREARVAQGTANDEPS